MGSIGFSEIVVILLLALLLFGPKKLPEVGRIIGKTIREMRKITREFTSSLNVDDSENDDEKG